ncbi:MAG: O-antigen ligase family protein [bacterium]|nr:O-antigen ligase family protein [bacterium]
MYLKGQRVNRFIAADKNSQQKKYLLSIVDNIRYFLPIFFVFGLLIRALYGKITELLGVGNYSMRLYILTFFGLFVISLPKMYRILVDKRAIDVPIIIAFISFAVVCTYVFNPDVITVEYMDTTSIARVFVYYIPIYISARAIDDYDKFLGFFVISAKIAMVWMLNNYFYVLEQLEKTNKTYDLGFGYSTVFLTMVIVSNIFNKNKRNIYDFFFVIMGTYMVLSIGSRGGFVVLLAYVGVQVLLKVLNNSKIYIKAIYITTIAVVLSNFRNIIEYLYMQFMSFGIYSRTLSSIIYDTMDDSSGRDIIWASAVEGLQEASLLGYGVCGDRQFAKPFYGYGFYVHNFFLEILLQYGVIIGTVIFIFLFYFIIKSLRNKKTIEITSIFIVYCAVNMVLSSSYLLNEQFWALLGFVIFFGSSRNHKTPTGKYLKKRLPVVETVKTDKRLGLKT